ncbi:2-hydroxyacid dehydrogenase [Pigmentiphaga litoralis]|uniref:2-hydroxyacid dehydrogenase n=1 Tax=Pigmentiphaga litoralis TaxID=516702 RepID=UPI00167AB188|nr:2-hydroxyacid dehydrogenase [Pigmentiphaga litoralis]GGX06879.1 2-hydroxyacid dehydrogenase [Pigmentiphaga litoralis]
MTTSRRRCLVLHRFSAEHLAEIEARLDVVYAPDTGQQAEAIATHGGDIDIVLTIGARGLMADEMDAMPKLALICALGAGYERLDVDAARARGIATVNGAGANDACVADHAMGLLLAVTREIPRLDQRVRQGGWREGLQPPASVYGKRLGIIGLGTIGRQIARRAAGFDLAIGYHNRRQLPDIDHRYFDTPTALAQWADILVVATPGGADTRHIVNAQVLQALGPRGYLINIARGSVVDTAALAQALRDGVIAGAGLDVYESEPDAPAELITLDNVVLTPHVAGASPEAIAATVASFLDNAERQAAGRPLRTPI